MNQQQTTNPMCETCKGTKQVLFMWDRPGGAPGNGYGPCPACQKQAAKILAGA